MNNLDAALTIVKTNLGVTGESRDAELTELLELSAGTKNDKTWYRPYIVTAYYLPLMGLVQRSGLIEADGAKWVKPSELMPLASHLLSLQEANDCGVEGIDDCWSTNTVRVRLQCGCDAEKGETTSGLIGAMVI